MRDTGTPSPSCLSLFLTLSFPCPSLENAKIHDVNKSTMAKFFHV